MNKILPVLLFLLVTSGCKFFGADPAPPSKAETYLFDVVTNLVPRQTWKTNYIDVPVPVFVLKTNEQNQITQLTNTVIIKQVELERATNWVEAYTWTQKTNTVQLTQTAGSIANIAAPGSGGLVVGILGTVLAAWAKLRSSKKTNINLAQGTETLLELLQALPDGNKNVAVAKQFLKSSQEDQGLRDKIKTIIRDNVDTSDAKSDAAGIKAALDTGKPLV